MPGIARLPAAAVALAVLTAAPTTSSLGQTPTMTEGEMRAAFQGRNVSVRSAGTGTWIILTMGRDGRCSLTWSSGPYTTRCQIRGNEFCYHSRLRGRLVCGTMARLGAADYLFRVK